MGIAQEREGNPQCLYSCCSKYKFSAIEELCSRDVVEGSIIEVGVYRGGMGMHLAMIFPNRPVYLVDTFTGIPYSSEHDNFYRPGHFANVNVDDVRKSFHSYPNAIIMQGIFPGQIVERFNSRIVFAVVHIDVDIYQGYKDCLEYFYPRVPRGGIVFLDDYLEPECRGATVACEEFMRNVPETIQELTGQRYFIKE
jgi:O-methyltransferase